MCLAHWIISRRTINVVLVSKSSILSLDKPFPAAVNTVGDLLVARRKAAGLTQGKAAELAGIHRQWLGRWERGRALPSPPDWTKLRTLFDLPVEPKLP
jgi:DNA-binding XRE family transcriptional regulator